jgi:hypothetical protein
LTHNQSSVEGFAGDDDADACCTVGLEGCKKKSLRKQKLRDSVFSTIKFFFWVRTHDLQFVIPTS